MLTNKEKINDLIKRKEQMEVAGGQKRIQSQHEKGKLTARERMKLLFDDGIFEEVDGFAMHNCDYFGMKENRVVTDGVITGYGQVNGRLVFAFAQDFTVIGGSLGLMHAEKISKIQNMALKVGAPVVGLNDSGGARIQEGIDALAGYGKIFYNNVQASGVIPQITAIMGPCAGGAVYSPGLNDFVFMVDKTSQMFITGPEVIKSVTGEIVSAEDLGGAMAHNSISGVAHFVSPDDKSCIQDIKRLLSFLPSNNMESAPVYEAEQITPIPALEEIVPDNSNKPYDIKEIIHLLADGGDFYEVQPHFAKNIVVGFARINGKTVGVIANQPKFQAGCLDFDASDKSSRFIRNCDAFGIPLLYIVDVPGFLPGTKQEYSGIIRHGAKMLYAASEATVPKVTMIVRKAYGGSYIAMCSKELGADMVFAWPNAEIAVMGPSGAANIVFRSDIKNSEDPAKTRQEKIDEYTKEFATPYKAAEKGYVDEVIEPKMSKIKIANALSMLQNKSQSRPNRKHGNIPL